MLIRRLHSRPIAAWQLHCVAAVFGLGIVAGCNHAPARASLPPLSPLPQDASAALFQALKDHDTGRLKSLLSAGASPSSRDPTGHGLLNLAAQNGDLAAISLILAAGAGINEVDHFGPPLWYAVTFRQSSAVALLLSHGASVDARNSMDQTSLIWAVRSHRTEMVSLLLAAGADVHVVDRTKVPLLSIASLANDLEIVDLLRKAGASFTSPEEEMMAAAAQGDATRIRELIAAGTPVDFSGSSYASPAAGETPLMAAAEKGQTFAVQTLLAAGASVNAVDREHRTALFYAIKSGRRSTVDQLLAAGADPRIRMGGGGTVLMHLASFMDDSNLARAFIAAGVDPNATTDNSSIYTALMPAASMGHIQVLKVLLEAGADINFQTVLEGDTALINAARSGHADCVRLLLQAGADPTLRDHRDKSGTPGRTALDWAIDFHHPEIAALLQTTH
jgi:ankyrin repeat protein